MAGRVYEGAEEDVFTGLAGPSPGKGVLLSVVVFAALWLNGRPIPEGSEVGLALLGKAVSSLAAALAANALFQAVARRHPTDEAAGAALLLVFGTSLWSASQSWSRPALAACAVALTIFALARDDEDEAWGDRAGLFAPIAAVLDLPSAALGGVVVLALLARRPGRVLKRALFLAIGVIAAFLLRLFLSYGPFAMAQPGLELAGRSPAALLVAPSRGVLVFAPILLLGLTGLLRALLRAQRFLPAVLLVGLLAQSLVLAAIGDVHAGRTWGSLAFTAAAPGLLLFLPEGLATLRYAGVLLAALSVAAQALGAFTYDQRWDRLFRTDEDRIPERVLWSAAESPMALALRERVLRIAAPARRGGRFVVNEHPVVFSAPSGSFLAFGSAGLVVTGGDPAFGDVFLEGGARIEGTRLVLRAEGDGVFLRVAESARALKLELRVTGRGHGTVVIGERTFWTEPRFTVHPVEGDFRLRKLYFYPESGGPDLRIALSAPGSVELLRVALVPPNEPENVLRLP
jgi:hypothetical protein